MLGSATPRQADRLAPLRAKGTSAWTPGTEHFLSNRWACPPRGITEPDTALLTHETNTCELFKNISIKLPGWLRAAPIHSAPAPSSPSASHSTVGKGGSKGGQNLLEDFFTLFPGTVQFLISSRLARSVEHGLALARALSRQSEETLEGGDHRTCRLQVRDQGHGLLLA